MYIETLFLKNFRNYSEETFSFGPFANILVGANAQGKTNLAEAVFFLCTGYSPKATKEKELIKKGETSCEIYAKANSDYGAVTMKAVLTADGGKKFTINGVEVSKIGDIFGNINSVFFNPSELKLVQESPEDRRRFMNVSLSEMSRPYFYALCKYNKILSQRNNLLKSGEYSVIRDTLSVWDEQLSGEAAKIFKLRNDFLSELAPFAAEIHAAISGGEKLKISPENSFKGTEEEIADLMFIELKNSFEKDLRLGFTNVGPHREDIKFVLSGQDVRKYGSQGQQRTVALSLKLAEAEIFRKRFGEYPVLILDDVLSELDRKRQRELIKRITKMQTILTATHVESPLLRGTGYKQFTVEGGRIIKEAEKLPKMKTEQKNNKNEKL